MTLAPHHLVTAGLALATLLGATSVSSPPQEPVITWEDGPALTTARDHHAVFVVPGADGDRLYAAGGTNYDSLFDNVESALIRADGSLGPWQPARPLPGPRSGASVVDAGGVVVLTGGVIATEGGTRGLRRIPEVYTAAVDRDGGLGPWRRGPDLPAARFHHPLLVHDGWLYVVGGQGEVEAEDGVFAARVGADGELSAWKETTPLPRPRSHHAALILGDHVYVFGGQEGRPGTGDQAALLHGLRAPLLGGGELGEWEPALMVPHSLATHSALFHEGHVWLFGGVEDLQRFSDVVWRGPLQDNGFVGPWEAVDDPLPVARGHVHVTPVVNGRVYSTGGRVTGGGSRVTAATHIGRLGG